MATIAKPDRYIVPWDRAKETWAIRIRLQLAKPMVESAVRTLHLFVALLCAVVAFAGSVLAQPGPFLKPGGGGFGPMKPPGFQKGGDFPGARAPVSYVDVHVHPVPIGQGATVTSSLDDELSAMDQAGMRKMILMPTPQTEGQRNAWDYESFLEALRRQPGRFAFLGGGGSLNVIDRKSVV